MTELKKGRLYKTKSGVVHQCLAVYDDVVIMETYGYSPQKTSYKKTALLKEDIPEYMYEAATEEDIKIYILELGERLSQDRVDLQNKEILYQDLVDKAVELCMEKEGSND